MGLARFWQYFAIATLQVSWLGIVGLHANWCMAAEYDVILRRGTVYDGLGGPPVVADIGIRGDRIVDVGDLRTRSATEELDVNGLAVAPGFINMLSWACDSLMADGHSQSDLRQGVTLEVFGEGVSYGPLNVGLKEWLRNSQGDIRYDVTWSTLDEYLRHLVDRGISTNVASFVGATTLRMHEIGFEDRPPTPKELATMKELLHQAMRDGALGVASSLIYAPAFYAKRDELVELCKVVAEYDGLYITHMRSEGNRLLEGVDEVLEIARTTGVRAEIYHLKAAGTTNWHKLDQVIERINAARAAGLRVTADMYNYTAAATGLDAAMPPWAQEGGYQEWVRRLQAPDTRLRVLREMQQPSDDWENLMLLAGSPDNVLLVGFKSDSLKPLTGKTLAEAAKVFGKSPAETAIDLVIADGSRVEVVYFLMSEDNVRKQLQQPWVSFCSDSPSMAPEGVFLKSSTHPRAYGSFARLLAKYVREEQVLPLTEAIRRLTSFPADNLGIASRGRLAANCFADVVAFDPEAIQDHATFQQPQQFATGVHHVLVNGQIVLRDGNHTGATPGQVVRRERQGSR